jgi:hypothetical protein
MAAKAGMEVEDMVVRVTTMEILTLSKAART